jgi:N-sulfoglucosamine sulfohydrolase
MVRRARYRLLVLACLLPSLGCFAWLSAAEQPNVLLVMADDCTYSDLPVYGGRNAKTPHLDRLASQGLTFNRAYLSSAMCQPCRAELHTGQYPLRNGCAWNHSASRPETESTPHYLRPLGYRVGMAGKVHVQPAQAFPFETVAGYDQNAVRNPTQPHDIAGVREFVTRDRSQPFCLVVALVEPHIPWVMGDASQYPPNKLALPPNIADTPRTREDFSHYLAEITYMDGQVGELLALLDAEGLAEQTLVLFTSEQGSQFPGNKWTNYDTGVHTALIARWPGRIAPGTRTDALVQYADVLPTVLDLAGGRPTDAPFDGSSFGPVLLGRQSTHRQHVYGIHNNIPEGPAYPLRSVSDGTYRYIRNLTPDEIYIEKHVMGISGDGSLNNKYWPTWVWHSTTDRTTYDLVKRYTRRPAEELYHTASDPFELVNLANDPAQRETKARLSAELDRWMSSQGDPGAAVDKMEAFESGKRGQHVHGGAGK